MAHDTGIVFNIQRYSINDGPGIRTCVFLKGCPLNCLWCHNPESKCREPELSFSPAKCIGCGKCQQVCPRNCHSFANGRHLIDRVRCKNCGKCTRVCVGALELIGKEMQASEIITEVCKDQPFYETSGGGVTFTGGEPFAQPEFLLTLLQEAKRQGLHVCVETCGFVRREALKQAIPYIDLFLYDCKETNPEQHKKFTGVDNKLILDNLDFISNLGKRIVLRCPLVPGYNDRQEHLKAIAALANKYSGIIRIDVEPYHPLGKDKAESIGQIYQIQNSTITSKELTAEWIDTIQQFTDCEVRKG